MVIQDRRTTTRLFAERLGVIRKRPGKFLERDLQRREIFPRFVPHSEAVSCFQIDLCDTAPPLLPRFDTSRLFSRPKGDTDPKRTAFQRH
jgi:hypothetical protein